MKSKSILRFVAFTIVVIIMCSSSVAYVDEAYGVLHPEKVYSEGNRGIIIDGSDFTVICRIIGTVVSGILDIVVIGTYVAAMILISAIVFALLRIISIRKTTIVTEKEIKYTIRLIWISTAVSFVISIVLTNITFVLCAASLFWQMPLFAYSIYLFPLKKKSYNT